MACIRNAQLVMTDPFVECYDGYNMGEGIPVENASMGTPAVHLNITSWHFNVPAR